MEPPSPEDSWAQVELFRWQYGELPANNDFRPLDIPEAIRKMATALEVGLREKKPHETPGPYNVAKVMEYSAKLIEKLQK